MRGLLLIALLLLPAANSPATAAFDMQGADLLEWCADYADDGGGDGISAALCSGFIMGTAATLATLAADDRIPPMACPPADVTVTDFIRVVVRWLRDNPDGQDWKAEVAVAAALSEAFPCTNRGA